MSRRRKSKPFTLPKFRFAGLGIVYLLIFIPQIWAVKVGYTGVSIGSRVNGTSKAVFGFTFPIGFVVCPFAWHVEQWMHRMMAGLRLDFYKGDGHTETFWIPAAAIAYPIFALIWWMEYLAIKWVYFHYLTY